MKLLSPLRWLTVLATLLLAALLCWQCLDIYLDGNAPANLDANGVHLQGVFRMDDVMFRLKHLRIPLIACAVLLIFSLVLHMMYPAQLKKPAGMTAENRLRLAKARIAELPAAAAAEEKRRRYIWGAAWAVILVCAACSLHYLLDVQHFTSWDLEQVMGGMLLHTAPWAVIAFAAAATASLLCKGSILRELLLLKGAPSQKAAAKANAPQHRTNWLRACLYAVAVLFIVLGVMNGGLRDVLVKAINICTECIGLG